MSSRSAGQTCLRVAQTIASLSLQFFETPIMLSDDEPDPFSLFLLLPHRFVLGCKLTRLACALAPSLQVAVRPDNQSIRQRQFRFLSSGVMRPTFRKTTADIASPLSVVGGYELEIRQKFQELDCDQGCKTESLPHNIPFESDL